MKVNSEKFEYFHCPQKIVTGVNMGNFFKLIKTMGNSDTLELFIEKKNENVIGIKIFSHLAGGRRIPRRRDGRAGIRRDGRTDRAV